MNLHLLGGLIGALLLAACYGLWERGNHLAAIAEIAESQRDTAIGANSRLRVQNAAKDRAIAVRDARTRAARAQTDRYKLLAQGATDACLDVHLSDAAVGGLRKQPDHPGQPMPDRP